MSTIFDRYTSEELLSICHSKKGQSPLIDELAKRLETSMSLCQEFDIVDRNGIINDVKVIELKKLIDNKQDTVPHVISCPTCLADIKT